MIEITTDAADKALIDPVTGIAYTDTVDLDEYMPGDDVDDDALVLAEVLAFREHTGLSFPNSIDLEDYEAGEDVDYDALLLAELRAFRDLSMRKQTS